MKTLIKILFIMFLTPCMINAQPVTLGTGNSTSGSDGTYIGDYAGAFNTASNNTFVGRTAGYANSEGEKNTFLGVAAGYSNYIGKQNTFVGTEAGYSSSAHYNTFIGEGAGRNTTSGPSNTFVGRRSGYSNKTGKNNTFIGLNAGYINKASSNTFVGSSAGRFNSTGTSNLFLGNAAGFENTTGSRNTCLGLNSGRNNESGSDNIFIGYKAGFNETGSDKLYIDNDSDNSPLVYGDFASHYVGIAIDPTVDIINPNDYGLYVGKGILAERVKVATRGTTNWADYVFDEDYELNSTEEVEAFIKENKHLPNVPSAEEVDEDGIDMVEMDATLLRQIEELWLHVIELKKENDMLKEEVKTLQSNK